jgi:putative RNA 2'-phosphotransferase
VRSDEERRLLRLSKYLSKHLRHRPDRLGLELGAGGWVAVDALLEACARQRFPISRKELEDVVARNDKERFAFDPSGTLIRAQQGHSVPVDLLLEPIKPPAELYHGTHERNLKAGGSGAWGVTTCTYRRTRRRPRRSAVGVDDRSCWS